MNRLATSAKRWAAAAMFAALLFGPMSMVQARNDHNDVRRLLEAGEILSLETILTNIRPSYPGKILEIDLEREHGRIVYELEILGVDGVVREIKVDAHSGDILSEREDN